MKATTQSPHDFIYCYCCYSILAFILAVNFQSEIDAHGIDLDGPAPSEEWDGPINDDVGTVEVPSTECPLENETWELLSAYIDPLSDSDVNGVDIYLETVRFIETML